MNIPAISASSQSITVVFKDNPRPITVRSGTIQYTSALEAIKARDWDALKTAITFQGAVAKFTFGLVKIYEDSVEFNGKKISNYITKRILNMLELGLPLEPIANFLSKVMRNPSNDIRNELLQFLEHSECPLVENGNFLAYRRVQNDYLSFHPNPGGTKNRNRIGDVVTEDRNNVDHNRNSHCSYGLHFCAFSYLNQYHDGSGRIMVVEIDPVDVCSFPTDYHFAKARCCKYKVVGELDTNKPEKDTLKEKPLFEVNENGVRYYNYRVGGRFAKKTK